MKLQYLVFSTWMLQFSVAVHEERKVGLLLTDDERDWTSIRKLSHRRVLVNHDTLIQYGAVVFSKPGIDTYSTIMIHEDGRKEWKESIYVGARNWLIKFDPLLNETDAAEILPSLDEIESCKKENPAEDCYNFIKHIHVVGKFATKRIEVCGTFAHSPACSGRLATNLSKEIVRLPGLSPGNPRGSVAAYFTGKKLFLGFVDPKTEKSKILDTTLNKGERIIHTIENQGWLNEAEFVGAFSTSKKDEFVYIVFTEIAIEAPVYGVNLSRVARICKDDSGGPDGGHENVFGSFIKAHLDCGGQHSKVQSISYVENDPYLWATFASDGNSGTAICGFSITEIESAFRGPYLYHDDKTGQWEKCPPPYLLPGDSSTLTCFGFRSLEAVVNYTMMSNTVSHNCSKPSFITDAILTKLAVSSVEQDAFTAYAGDDLGRVWKIDFTNCEVSGDVQTWEVVPANHTSKEINGLAIHNDSIIVLTREAVLKILSQKQYPGEIIYEPTNQPLPPTSPAPRRPTAKSEIPNFTKRIPNNSRSQYEFSCSQITVFLIATAIM